MIENADFGSGDSKYITKGAREKYFAYLRKFVSEACRGRTPCSEEFQKCAPENQKAREGRTLPALLFVLRQVIAERREDHIVDSVWSRGDTFSAGGSPPSIAGNIGILCSPLHTALFSVVEAIPESHGAFDDDPGIACAVSQRARNKPDGPEDRRGIGRVAWSGYGQRFSRTAIISECGRSVSGRASFPGNQVGKAVGSAAGILSASVEVNIQLWRGVQFECAQCLIVSQQCESAVRANGRIHQLSGAVAADPASTKEMDANLNLLAEQRHASIGTNATTGSSIIEGAGSGAGGTSERASCWRNWSRDVCGILTWKSGEGEAVVCKVAREDTIPERRN